MGTLWAGGRAATRGPGPRLLVVGDQHDSLGAAPRRPGSAASGSLAPVVPGRLDDPDVIAGGTNFSAAALVCAPRRCSSAAGRPAPGRASSPSPQLGHRQAVAQRHAKHIIRLACRFDDHVGRRRKRGERHFAAFRVGSFSISTGLNRPPNTATRLGMGANSSILRMPRAGIERWSLVTSSSVRPPSTPPALDLGDGAAHAQLHRLGRDAVIEPEFGIQAHADGHSDTVAAAARADSQQGHQYGNAGPGKRIARTGDDRVRHICQETQ